MDRFLMKMSMGYPDRAEEKAILARRKLRGKDEHDVEQVANPKKVVAMQKSLEAVHVDPAILSYIVEIVQRTREDNRVINGASPRASQSLFKSGRAVAAIDGRDYVVPDDIKSIALQIISHRIVMKPESKIEGSPACTSFARSSPRFQLPSSQASDLAQEGNTLTTHAPDGAVGGGSCRAHTA